MSKIVYVNLSSGTVSEKNYNPLDRFHYGRGLATELLIQEVPVSTSRYSPENCIVLVPGLFSGTAVPSTGRLTVAAKKSADAGIQFLNLAGPMALKLGSLDIAALVITSKNENPALAVLIVGADEIKLVYRTPLKGLEVSETVSSLREEFGRDSAIIGIGPAGEHQSPLAAVFTTYPPGVPVFSCARGGMGDILGSKGLKAVLVNSDSNFSAPVADSENMKIASRKIARIITHHPVCGGALPAYGSITLMKIMKEGNWSALEKGSPVNKDKPQPQMQSESTGKVKINKSCAPRCVVGCLNRHTAGSGKIFSSPAESEVSAALVNALSIDDAQFASLLNQKAFDLGLDSVEFVFTCSLYFKLLDIEPNQKEIEKALEEIRQTTTIGRILGSKTEGLYSLYEDRPEYEPMVTRPSINEGGLFNVKLPCKLDAFADVNDREYLYASMICQSNLGICLFTSFALIENAEALKLLTDLYRFKTGMSINETQLIQYGFNCINKAEEYEREARIAAVHKEIPEFVKVLHRYFSKDVTTCE